MSRWVPINYFLLLIITIGESYMLSMICTKYTPESVFMVFLLTCAGFVGMTFYAFFTKHDISIFYSVASGASMLMFTFSIILFFTHVPVLVLIYSVLGVLFGLVYVAIDT